MKQLRVVPFVAILIALLLFFGSVGGVDQGAMTLEAFGANCALVATLGAAAWWASLHNIGPTFGHVGRVARRAWHGQMAAHRRFVEGQQKNLS